MTSLDDFTSLASPVANYYDWIDTFMPFMMRRANNNDLALLKRLLQNSVD